MVAPVPLTVLITLVTGYDHDRSHRRRLTYGLQEMNSPHDVGAVCLDRLAGRSPNHRLCGQVTLDALFPYARDRLHYPEQIEVEGLETHKVGDVLLWGTEEPDTFFDITDTIEMKIQALKKHASQISAPGTGGRDVDEFIKANASRIGQRADFPYAEAFRRIEFRR